MYQWWARRESNSRSLPCQGNVITPRPRALGSLATIDAYLFTSVGRVCTRKWSSKSYQYIQLENKILQIVFSHWTSWFLDHSWLVRTSYISDRSLQSKSYSRPSREDVWTLWPRIIENYPLTPYLRLGNRYFLRTYPAWLLQTRILQVIQLIFVSWRISP